MKTADIKPGTEYAYSSYEWGTPSRVLVLETGVARKEGYGYSARTIRNGVRVRFLGGYAKGTETVVPGREIRKPWSEHAEAEEKARAARAALESHRAETLNQRVLDAKEMLPGLRALGLPIEGAMITVKLSEEQRAGLNIEPMGGEYNAGLERLVEPNAIALVKFIERGERVAFRTEDVIRLINLAASSALRQDVLG